MRRVKVLVFLVVVVAALFASGALLWRHFEPDLREQVEQAVSARLQTEVEIGSLRPRIRGFLLSDIHVADRSRGIRFQIEQMILTPSPWALLVERQLVVDALHLRGVDAYLPRREFGPPASWERFLPLVKQNLSAVGFSVDAVRSLGVTLTSDAVIRLSELRVWLVSETGERALVHEEPQVVLTRSGDKLVLVEED